MLKTCLQLFIVIISFSLLNVLFVQLNITNEIYIQTYTGQLSAEMIAKMLSLKIKYSWLNYLLTPILLFVKTGLVAVCFWIGSFIRGSKSMFKDFLKVVLFAEIVFVVFSFMRTGLLYHYNFQTLTEISQFQPLTLYSVLDVTNIPAYWQYPLTLISIPEAIYWVVLVLLLNPLISGDFWSRLGFVAKTYGVGLLVWISIVVFITLNFSA